MRRPVVLVAAIALVVGGLVRAAPAGDGQAWIDSPLSGSVVVPGTLQVVAHATDPDGVVEVRLDVDGVTEGSVVPPAAGETLVTASLGWTPTALGLHRLEVFGRDASGEWGAPGRSRVWVELGDVTTTTTTTPGTSTSVPAVTVPPTVTTRPSPTTTAPTRPGTTVPTTSVPRTTVPPPSTTVCAVGQPSPAGVAATDTLTPRLTWSYAGCREPERFDVEVSRDAGFARVEAAGSVGGGSRTWTSDPLSDCTSYFWRVRATDGGSAAPWSSAGSFAVQTVRSCG